MRMLSNALSSYGSGYSSDFAKACKVEIPQKSDWCGVFIGALLAGIDHELPTNPQVARSYLKIGKPIDKPKIGDLVVFWRFSPSDWRGHVGIYIREDDTGVFCLGGNQKGKVQITRYNKDRILGYRRIIDGN